jgi:transcriptional regulator with XRE-family HTH domain
MADDTAFGAWLRREMPRRGYPLEGPRAGGKSRLADDARISRASMSRLVDGSSDPSLDALRKIGAVFRIPLGEMLVHADMAEPGEIGGTHDLQREGLGEIIDDLKKMVRKLEGTPEPLEPPGGFRHEFERDIWGLWRIPWPQRYAAILGKRAVDDAERTIADIQTMIRTEDTSPPNGQTATG